MAEQPKGKKKHKKWPWIVLAVVAAVIVYFVVSVNQQLSSSYQQEKAQRRDIATYYSFSGNLSPVTDETQTAKEALKVKEIYIKEGDAVRMGDALLRGADGTRVNAAYDGTVETLYPEVDDSLQPGSQIARIVDYDSLEVSVDVDEYDIDALALGKTGDVYINALDRTVTGTVTEIARDATRSGGMSYYAVKMEVQPGENVRSGMSVDVSVLKNEAKGCVSIATKALSYDSYNKPYVLVKNDKGEMAVQYVTLGVSDGLYTEITEGLSENADAYYFQNDMMRFFAMQQDMRTQMTAN